MIVNHGINCKHYYNINERLTDCYDQYTDLVNSNENRKHIDLHIVAILIFINIMCQLKKDIDQGRN